MELHFICVNSQCRFAKTKKVDEEIEDFCPKCASELIYICPECDRPIENHAAEFCSFCKKRLIN